MTYELHILEEKPIGTLSGRREEAVYEDERPSDVTLWNLFRRGDEGAFISIYKDYFSMLFSYGCRCTSDEELVRDCLQDFFVYLKENRCGFCETTSIKAYLLKSFRRRVIDYLKKNDGKKELEKYIRDNFLLSELSVEAAYINQQVSSDRTRKLYNALEKLSVKEKKAIYYFYFKDFSYRRIATLLDFNHVSSVRRLMYRSIEHLRNFYFTI